MYFIRLRIKQLNTCQVLNPEGGFSAKKLKHGGDDDDDQKDDGHGHGQ